MNKMFVELAVTLTDGFTLIKLPEDQGNIAISTIGSLGISVQNEAATVVSITKKAGKTLAIDLLDIPSEESMPEADKPDVDNDQIIIIVLPKTIDACYFKQLISQSAGIASTDNDEELTFSPELAKATEEHFTTCQFILKRFGTSL